MNIKEKKAMISTYETQFKHFLASGSDFEKLILDGQKQMMKLFFTEQEIMKIENNIRVTSEYKRSYFENIESWLKQINKEIGEKIYLFEWTKEGVEKVENIYDWLFNQEEYQGLKFAIENTLKLFIKVA